MLARLEIVGGAPNPAAPNGLLPEPASVVVSPARDRSSQRAEQGQHRTRNQGDNAQCPQHGDPEQEAHQQQDDTQRNNDELLTWCSRGAFERLRWSEKL